MFLLELSHLAGISPKKAAGTQGGEYKSSCPSCGGTDRFFMHPYRQMKNCTGYYQCRKCDKKGDSIQFCIDFLGMSFKEAVEKVGTNSFEFKAKPTKPSQNGNFRSNLTISSVEWIKQATKFVNECHIDLLWHMDHAAHLVNERKFPIKMIEKYKLGSLKEDRWVKNWTDKDIWIPSGIVIPWFDQSGKNVVRLKIRRLHGHPKYVVVSGGMNGCNIIGDRNMRKIILVESELDAYLLHYFVGDMFCISSLGSNMKNPDKFLHSICKRSEVYICPDNDEAGDVMYNKFISLYPNAIRIKIPEGKDIGEYHKQGYDIRKFILSSIGE